MEKLRKQNIVTEEDFIFEYEVKLYTNSEKLVRNRFSCHKCRAVSEMEQDVERKTCAVDVEVGEPALDFSRVNCHATQHSDSETLSNHTKLQIYLLHEH